MYIVVSIDRPLPAKAVAIAATLDLAKLTVFEWGCNTGERHIIELPDEQVQSLLLATQRKEWEVNHS